MITVFSISSAVLFCFLVLFLVYKGKLKEQYAILWIVLSGGILYFSIFRDSLEDLAQLFGVFYAPSLLFVFAFLIMLLLLIQLSVVVSNLKENIKKMTQEIGLLKNKLEENKNDKQY